MKATENLRQITEYLPAAVRSGLQRIPDAAAIQEIRLRAGRPVSLTTADGSVYLGAGVLTQNPAAALVPSAEEIARSLQAVLSYSVHSHQQELAEGFVTVRGGCRVGICGTAVRSGSSVQSLKAVSGLNFRIAGECTGAAASVFRQTGQAGGILTAGHPGSGKTTFLRDLCRLLGDRHRTVLVDERGELAAVYRGVPQYDVGLMTDVLDGYPRAEGILTALRVLNPEHIICDELLTDADVQAVLAATGCGVQVSASVHAGSLSELDRRMLLTPLLEAGAFRYGVLLEGTGQVQGIRRLG